MTNYPLNSCGSKGALSGPRRPRDSWGGSWRAGPNLGIRSAQRSRFFRSSFLASRAASFANFSLGSMPIVVRNVRRKLDSGFKYLFGRIRRCRGGKGGDALLKLGRHTHLSGCLRFVYGLDAIEDLSQIALCDLNIVIVLQVEPKLCGCVECLGESKRGIRGYAGLFAGDPLDPSARQAASLGKSAGRHFQRNQEL